MDRYARRWSGAPVRPCAKSMAPPSDRVAWMTSPSRTTSQARVDDDPVAAARRTAMDADLIRSWSGRDGSGTRCSSEVCQWKDGPLATTAKERRTRPMARAHRRARTLPVGFRMPRAAAMLLEREGGATTLARWPRPRRRIRHGASRSAIRKPEIRQKRGAGSLSRSGQAVPRADYKSAHANTICSNMLR